MFGALQRTEVTLPGTFCMPESIGVKTHFTSVGDVVDLFCVHWKTVCDFKSQKLLKKDVIKVIQFIQTQQTAALNVSFKMLFWGFNNLKCCSKELV